MLTSNYSLKTIQSHAYHLNVQSTSFFASLLGANGQLTPQMIVDQFSELDQSYQLLKSRVEAVQQSLDSGHDPDRYLFLNY